MKNLSIKNKIIIFIGIVTVVYFILPVFFYSFDIFSNYRVIPNSLKYKVDEITAFSLSFNIYLLANYLIFIFLIFYLYKFYLSLDFKLTSFSNTNNEIFNIAILLIYYICLALVFLDFYKLYVFIIKYDFQGNISLFVEQYRDDIRGLIFQRRTHFKILIIISVFLYSVKKNHSIFGYVILFVYTILSLARYEFVILILLHFFYNIRKVPNKKKIILFFLMISLLILYRSFLLFYNNENIEVDTLAVRFFSYNIGEGVSVFSTFFRSYFIFENYIRSFLALESYQTELLINFILNNIYYIFNNFFYLNLYQLNFESITIANFLFSNFLFANFPTSEIILLPITFLLSILILTVVIKIAKKFLINTSFVNVCILYMIATSFRGSILHETLFIAKFIILTNILLLFFFIILKIFKNRLS